MKDIIKFVLKYIRKYPFISGLLLIGIYICCKEPWMLYLNNAVYSLKAPLLGEEKEEIKKDEYIEAPLKESVEMIDPSMFDESLKFNESIAELDGELEDAIDEAYL